MPGAFQTKSYWFLLDNQSNDLGWAQGPGTDEAFDRRMASSGRLPHLGPAPVSSWIVARLARLSGGLPPGSGRQADYGSAYRLALLVFDKEQSPLGSVELVGDLDRVGICVECLRADLILTELAEALLAQPGDVSECRVEAYDVDDEAEAELEGRGSEVAVPFVYGYERGMYLPDDVA